MIFITPQPSNNELPTKKKWPYVLLLVVLIWPILHLLAWLGWWLLLPIFCGFIISHKIPFQRLMIWMGMLIIMYGLSVGWIFIEHAWLQRSLKSSGANMIVPSVSNSRKFGIGQIVRVDLQLQNFSAAYNVAQIDVQFDTNKLELIDFSAEKSFARIFIQHVVDNQIGFTRLTGGLPSPGYVEPNGSLATLLFKTKQAGVATINVLPSSKVLANDGKATNLLQKVGSTSLFINPFANSQSIYVADGDHQSTVNTGSEPIIAFEADNSSTSHLTSEQSELKQTTWWQTILAWLELFDDLVIENVNRTIDRGGAGFHILR